MKTELKKLVFPSSDSEPVVVCEDVAKFAMAMSVFQNYERLVGSQSGKHGVTTKSNCIHFIPRNCIFSRNC